MKNLFFRPPENMSFWARNAFLIATLVIIVQFVATVYYLNLGQSVFPAQFTILAVISFMFGVGASRVSSASWQALPVAKRAIIASITLAKDTLLHRKTFDHAVTK